MENNFHNDILFALEYVFFFRGILYIFATLFILIADVGLVERPVGACYEKLR